MPFTKEYFYHIAETKEGKEGRKDGRKEGGRKEGRKEGRREGGKEGRREGGREGGREGDTWCNCAVGVGWLPSYQALINILIPPFRLLFHSTATLFGFFSLFALLD